MGHEQGSFGPIFAGKRAEQLGRRQRKKSHGQKTKVRTRAKTLIAATTNKPRESKNSLHSMTEQRYQSRRKAQKNSTHQFVMWRRQQQSRKSEKSV